MSAEPISNTTPSSSAPSICVHEMLKRSDLPELYGVPRRLIESLDRRIGGDSLDIEDVCGELGYSRRTLQRRLREQGFSFSELRDKVRCRYAILRVLHGRDRIDDIYTALDFSDRSSLTIAFRRWTGLSPRAFGRLYRAEFMSECQHMQDVE